MRPRTFCLIFASAMTVIGLSAAPAAPSHHHSVSIHDGHRHPITDCSDLHIEFDDRDAVVRSEEHTDRKSTRLNSSHPSISYAVYCLKKKNASLRSPQSGHGCPNRPSWSRV